MAGLRAENSALKKQLREREERTAALEERFAKLESAVERLAPPPEGGGVTAPLTASPGR